MARVIVGPVDSVPPATHKRVTAGARAIVVFNVEGRFYALRDICPHQGARLSDGVLVSRLHATGPGCYRFDPSRKLVKCPRHGFEYDLETGESWYDPKRDRVRALEVSVESGADLLAVDAQTGGRLVAQTVPISVEDDYLVVEI